MGGKIIQRIRLTSAKVLVEVEAELGNIGLAQYINLWGVGSNEAGPLPLT